MGKEYKRKTDRRSVH